MKTGGEREFSVPPKRRTHAFTNAELIAIIAVIGFTGLLMLPSFFVDNRARLSPRTRCLLNLKQVSLAFRVYEGDNNNQYPMSSLTNRQGALLFADVTNEFRYFQIMSNELSNPQILICPDDKKHHAATNFTTDLNNNHISFFVGLYADKKFPQMFLAGDNHLTNGLPVKNGILELLTNRAAGWTKERHGGMGNVAMADGSVMQFSSSGLRIANQHAAPKTNLLLMPQ